MASGGVVTQMPGHRAVFTELKTNTELAEFVERAVDVTDLPTRTELKTAIEGTVFPIYYGRVSKVNEHINNTYIDVIDLDGLTTTVTMFGACTDDTPITVGDPAIFYNLVINYLQSQLMGLKFSDSYSSVFKIDQVTN
jgi:hypothetical protein